MIHTIDANPTTVTRRTDVRPTVSVRSEAEIESIARAGALVGEILEDLRSRVRPGTTTAVLADRAACLIEAAYADALPLSCVNEDGDCFTHAICTSVDDVVLHGVPNDTPLVEGQIVTLDCSLRLDGWCADAAPHTPKKAPWVSDKFIAFLAHRACKAPTVPRPRPRALRMRRED